MLLSDTIFETFSAITSNKARSGLTVLGIVIGIASVIAMLAIGNGAQKDITDQIEGIGSNLLMVMPGSQKSFGYVMKGGGESSKNLTMEDSAAIQEQIDLVERVAPTSSRKEQLVSANSNSNNTIMGVTVKYSEVKNVEISQGSFISEKQNKNRSKVIVLGFDVVSELFERQEDVVGKKVQIGGVNFSIIGIAKPKGGSGMINEDENVYIPLSTYQQYLQGDNYLSLINLQVVDQESMSEAQAQIEALLLARHKIVDLDDADFNIFNQSDIVEMASSATDVFTVLLGAVAGISLVVGGIGIMNMMLTNVTERTREIGLRKSIGAQKGDISKQFLFESIVLTFIGGVIGIILGILVALGVAKFGGISTEISAFSIFLAVGVSAFIGIVFGYYPARRAANLNPIDALRYE